MLMPVRYILHLKPIEDTDSMIGVIQDAKFKRREALADLAKTASKK
jgi:hypothetical protein